MTAPNGGAPATREIESTAATTQATAIVAAPAYRASPPNDEFDVTLPDLRVDQAWRQLAACNNMPTQLFYSEREGSTGRNGHYPPEVEEACRRCPVRKACLDYALTNREKFGYWAGTTPRERQQMLRGKAVCVDCQALFARASRGQQFYCPDCYASRSA